MGKGLLPGGSSAIARKTATRRDVYDRYIKRGFDMTVAVALLPIIAPVIAVLWLLTIRDGGPGFFGHGRVGRNGRDFRCWKIRTMVPDAEARLREHLAADPAAAREWRRDFKLRDDPRITPLGRFLRRTSLDELPQIWNVLTGEMSFVGPRPVTRAEIEKYRGYEWAYFAQRPGITGLWQVSGRNDIDYDARVRLDVDYLTRRSFATDCRILARTASAIAGATGR